MYLTKTYTTKASLTALLPEIKGGEAFVDTSDYNAVASDYSASCNLVCSNSLVEIIANEYSITKTFALKSIQIIQKAIPEPTLEDIRYYINSVKSLLQIAFKQLELQPIN